VEELVTVVCYVTLFIEEDVVITFLASTVITIKLCDVFSYTFVAFVGLKCPFWNSSVKLEYMLDTTLNLFFCV